MKLATLYIEAKVLKGEYKDQHLEIKIPPKEGIVTSRDVQFFMNGKELKTVRSATIAIFPLQTIAVRLELIARGEGK